MPRNALLAGVTVAATLLAGASAQAAPPSPAPPSPTVSAPKKAVTVGYDASRVQQVTAELALHKATISLADADADLGAAQQRLADITTQLDATRDRLVTAQGQMDSDRQQLSADARASYITGPSVLPAFLTDTSASPSDRLFTAAVMSQTEKATDERLARATADRDAAFSALRTLDAQRTEQTRLVTTILPRLLHKRTELEDAVTKVTEQLLAARSAQTISTAGNRQRAQIAVDDIDRWLSHPDMTPSSGQPDRWGLAVLAMAGANLGLPYQWGGNGPDTYDCSGLTVAAYRAAGIALPRTAGEQYQSLAAQAVPVDDAEPGDLIFFVTDGTSTDPGHVAIVLDPIAHLMIHAPQTGDVIRVATYVPSQVLGAARPVRPAVAPQLPAQLSTPPALSAHPPVGLVPLDPVTHLPVLRSDLNGTTLPEPGPARKPSPNPATSPSSHHRH